MKSRRCAVAAVATAVLIPLTGAAGAPSAAAREAAPAYAALGDSYSSGVGADAYDSGSGDCRRSAHAYPQLYNAANSPAAFDFVACSGARTTDVLNDQLGVLNEGTGLVSISVGGNDIGFADVMTTCVVKGESACLSRAEEARAYIRDTLTGQLDAVYAAIRDRAPHASVVVLGYPRVYRLDGECKAGLSETSRAAINSAADDMSAVIQRQATSHGFAYGDTRPAFTGHEICSSDEWLHSVSVPDVDESYHPTAEGQSGGFYSVLDQLA